VSVPNEHPSVCLTDPEKPSGNVYAEELPAIVAATPSLTRQTSKQRAVPVAVVGSLAGRVTQFLARWFRIGRSLRRPSIEGEGSQGVDLPGVAAAASQAQGRE